jgi:hypothetical protein
MGAVHSCLKRREDITIANLTQALTIWQREDGISTAERVRRAEVKELLITRQTGVAPYCNLSYFYITTVPPCLGWFKHLIRLNLAHNNLVSLPAWIGELIQLQHLDVSYNKLTELPEMIGELSQLRILEVQYNCLETLPASLARLRYLQKVDVFDNPRLSLPRVLRKKPLFERVPIKSPAGLWRIGKDLIKELNEMDIRQVEKSAWLEQMIAGKQMFNALIARVEELNEEPTSQQEIDTVLQINIILLGMRNHPMTRAIMYQTSCQLYALEYRAAHFPGGLILQYLKQAYASTSSGQETFDTLLNISRQILVLSRVEQFIYDYSSGEAHENYAHFRLSMLSNLRAYLVQLHRFKQIDEETASFFNWVKPVKPMLRIPLSHIKAMAGFTLYPDEKSKIHFAEKLYEIYLWQNYLLEGYRQEQDIIDPLLYEAFESIAFIREEDAESAAWNRGSLDSEIAREQLIKQTFIQVLKNYL